MTVLRAEAPTRTSARYRVRLARDTADLTAIARLRHQVFAEEMGAKLTGTDGLDLDAFDTTCDHLLVVESDTDEVVGTYRLQPPGRGPRYCATEFDVTNLASIDANLVDAGRSCVRVDHRDGTVINLMWAGIARYMVAGGYRWLSGCASVSLADGGTGASDVWDLVQRGHLSPAEYRVHPYRPWQPGTPSGERVSVAPLLRGYLRLGAWICGEPAYDPDFGCTDLFVLLPLDRMNPRYLRHFLSAGLE